MSRPSTIPEAARELVDRSRAGDQNATAMIVQVRKGAKKGNSRALETVKCIKKYISENPVNPHVRKGQTVDGHEAIAELREYCDFGSETPKHIRSFQAGGGLPFLLRASRGSLRAAAGSLINACLLTPKVIEGLAKHMSDSSAGNLFLIAVMNYKSINSLKQLIEKAPAGVGHILAGAAVGYARDVQEAREGKIRFLSEMAAWELGEG